jgi:ferredoxin-NAD(P)+ reductase (naphthalene dioxygenase ferredoxin-specific)
MDLWGGGSQNRSHTETRANRLHMELTLEPLNRQLNVDVGQNLLDVLRAHDIPISYSCMAGRCGTCRCRVVRGKVLN